MTPSEDSVDRFGGLTSDQVSRLDAAAADCGVSTVQLMEIAGWQVARCAWEHAGACQVDVTVVAGHGNNGGDGIVAARHLATWGNTVRVVVVADETQVTGLTRDHVSAARENGVQVTIDTDPAALSGVTNAALIIDALLGTGLRSAPRDAVAIAIRTLNDAGRPTLSVDVPSGLDATSGEAFDPCVRATLTCTLTAMKQGLRSAAAVTHAGEIWVADIGMPVAAWGRAGLRRPPDVTGGELVHISS